MRLKRACSPADCLFTEAGLFVFKFPSKTAKGYYLAEHKEHYSLRVPVANHRHRSEGHRPVRSHSAPPYHEW